MNTIGLDHRRVSLILVLAGLLLAGGCSGAKDSASIPTQSVDLDVPSVTASWPQVAQRAQEWHPDVYLIRVRVKADHRGLRTADFYFESPSDNVRTFRVGCAIETCYGYEQGIRPAHPLTQCVPIDPDGVSIDSTDALALALDQGGADLLQRPTAYVLLSLSRHDPSCAGSMEWWVLLGDYAAFEVRQVGVDAVTGEIIETR